MGMVEHYAAVDTASSRLAAALKSAFGRKPVASADEYAALIGARSSTMDVRCIGEGADYAFHYAPTVFLQPALQAYSYYALPLTATVRRLQDAAYGGYLFGHGEDKGRMQEHMPPNLLVASGAPLVVSTQPRDDAGWGNPSIVRLFGAYDGNTAAVPRVRVGMPLPDDPRSDLEVYVSTERCRHTAGGEAPYFALSATLTHAGVSAWVPRDETVAEEGLAIAMAVLALCETAATPRDALRSLGQE